VNEGKICEKLAAVSAEIAALGKTERNKEQGFNFRGIDQVYNLIHPLLAKHGIITVPEIVERITEKGQTKSGSISYQTYVRVKYHLLANDGSGITGITEGCGFDTGDKSVSKALAIAHKYMILQTFTIPTEGENDPDYHTPEETVAKDFGFGEEEYSKFLEECKKIEKNIPADVLSSYVKTYAFNNGFSKEEVANRNEAEVYYRRLSSFVREYQENPVLATEKLMK